MTNKLCKLINIFFRHKCHENIWITLRTKTLIAYGLVNNK